MADGCFGGSLLAPYAVRVEDSRGRRFPEPAHPYRNDFQRDRDRVIHSRAFRGLNLTFEVREGIIKHSRSYAAAEFPQLAEYLLDRQPPLEAQLIDATDELAYSTADLDDGFEARLITLDQINEAVPVFAQF